MERSKASFAFAFLVIGMLCVAFLMPWFHYEQSSGRNTAEEGPYGEHKRTEYQNHTVQATGHSGDLNVEPGTIWILVGLATSAGSLLLAALGDIPGMDRIIRRRVALTFHVLAFLSIGGVLLYGWFAIPADFAAFGVTDAFTYFLEEPAGYTRTNIGYGWIAAGFAFLTTPLAWLYKFQAGAQFDLEATYA